MQIKQNFLFPIFQQVHVSVCLPPPLQKGKKKDALERGWILAFILCMQEQEWNTSGHDRILVRALIHKWEHCVLGQLLLFLPELPAPVHRRSRLCCRGVLVGHRAAELPQFITKQVEVAPCWFHRPYNVTRGTGPSSMSDLQLINIPLRLPVDTAIPLTPGEYLVLDGPRVRSSMRNYAEISWCNSLRKMRL